MSGIRTNASCAAGMKLHLQADAALRDRGGDVRGVALDRNCLGGGKPVLEAAAHSHFTLRADVASKKVPSNIVDDSQRSRFQITFNDFWDSGTPDFRHSGTPDF